MSEQLSGRVSERVGACVSERGRQAGQMQLLAFCFCWLARCGPLLTSMHLYGPLSSSAHCRLAAQEFLTREWGPGKLRMGQHVHPRPYCPKYEAPASNYQRRDIPVSTVPLSAACCTHARTHAHTVSSPGYTGPNTGSLPATTSAATRWMQGISKLHSQTECC